MKFILALINGMYAAGGRYIYKLDSGDYSLNWAFETDIYTGKSIDISTLRKYKCLWKWQEREH